MKLQIFHTEDKDFQLMQTAWASILEPVLRLPVNSGTILKSIELTIGANVINHRLGRKLQGWIVVGMHDAYSNLYDMQNTNQMPDKTLILNSSAATSIDLLVF